MAKFTSIEEYGLTGERLRELRITHLGLSINNLEHYYASNKGHLHIIAQIESWKLGQAVPTFNQLKILIEDIYRYPFIAIFAEVLPAHNIGRADYLLLTFN